jgi:anti-anti-sigma factor
MNPAELHQTPTRGHSAPVFLPPRRGFLQPDDPHPNDAPARGPLAPAVQVTTDAPGAVVVTLRGEHDLGSRAAVADALARAGERANVLVDLSECSFIDSTIIGVLLAAFQAQSERGARLELTIPPEAQPIHRVAQIAGLPTFMVIHETRIAGLASIRQVVESRP